MAGQSKLQPKKAQLGPVQTDVTRWPFQVPPLLTTTAPLPLPVRRPLMELDENVDRPVKKKKKKARPAPPSNDDEEWTLSPKRRHRSPKKKKKKARPAPPSEEEDEEDDEENKTPVVHPMGHQRQRAAAIAAIVAAGPAQEEEIDDEELIKEAEKHVDGLLLKDVWVGTGQASFAFFVEAVKVGPANLHLVDLEQFMNQDMVKSADEGRPVLYCWQLHVKNVEAWRQHLQGLFPSLPGWAATGAFARHLTWLDKHPDGGFLHYFGQSIRIALRYKHVQGLTSKTGHGNGLFHHVAKLYAEGNSDVLGFSFGVLARGPRIFRDHGVAIDMAQSLETQVGTVLMLQRDDYADINHHVINATPVGGGFGGGDEGQSIFQPILDQPWKLRELALSYYSNEQPSWTTARIRAHLKDVYGIKCALQTHEGFIRVHLKPLATLLGVDPSFFTNSAAHLRAQGSGTTREAMTDQVRLLVVEAGFRLSQRMANGHKWGTSLEDAIDLVFVDEDALTEPQLKALTAFVGYLNSVTGVAKTDPFLAKARKEMLALGEVIDEKEEKLPPRRAFDFSRTPSPTDARRRRR